MARRPPNFLFIVTDDQRFDALGAAGNPLIRTPFMDTIARNGVRFTQAFVSTSVCSASRAAMLTGRYGSGNGVPGLGGGLLPGEKTFVDYLKPLGYRMGFVGKWHLDHPADPARAGFDFATWFKANGPHYDRKVIEAGQQRTAPGFIEDYLAARAIDYLNQVAAPRTPFLLHFCSQLPHMNPSFDWDPRPDTLALYENTEPPLPQNWRDNLDGKPPYLRSGRHRERGQAYSYDKASGIRNHLRRYWASITDLDRSLGRVLEALVRLGLRDNTHVLLCGDNGWFMGEHGFSSKVLPYDESIRIPLLVAGPNLKPAVSDSLVMNIDLAPTILDLAGVAPPGNMHGRSLRPLLEGKYTGWRSAVLYEALAPTLGSWPLVAVRDRRWKYIQTFELNHPDRLAWEELYELEHDPGEMRNLASQPGHRTTRRMLEEELRNLRSAVADKLAKWKAGIPGTELDVGAG